ncbi:hypothetical protein GQ457_17G008990 [Hibiscus cannabinus]
MQVRSVNGSGQTESDLVVDRFNIVLDLVWVKQSGPVDLGYTELGFGLGFKLGHVLSIGFKSRVGLKPSHWATELGLIWVDLDPTHQANGLNGRPLPLAAGSQQRRRSTGTRTSAEVAKKPRGNGQELEWVVDEPPTQFRRLSTTACRQWVLRLSSLDEDGSKGGVGDGHGAAVTMNAVSDREGKKG